MITLYKILTDHLIDLCAINSHIVVGLGVPKPNYLKTAAVIRLILMLRSQSTLTKLNIPIIHGIVNAPRLTFFCTNDLVAITLQ